jgi:PEGA domain-containing protein
MSQKFTIGAVAVAFALSLTPVWAGQDKGQAGSRPSNGSSSGTATPRSGGDSSGGSSSSAGSSSSGSSSSSSSGSSSSGSSGSYGSGSSSRREAPQRPHADHRTGSQTATPRASGSSGERGAVRSGSGTTNSSAGVSSDSQGRDRGPVPAYSRPRDGRTTQGSAIERRTPINGGGNVFYPGVIYNPYSYYDPYYGYGGRYSSYWSPYGYGYGFGYFAYDPFLFGGYGSGYGGGYGGYDYPQSAGYGRQYYDTGALRLKVKPANAQVFIDGYYVGLVDSFDGVFQRLGIESGAHRVELKAEGYEPVEFEVMITPGETVTYRGELRRIH